MKAITILSGGMDSATLAYQIASEGTEQHFLSFNYGQRHVKELECAAAVAKSLNCKHDIIDLRSITHLLTGSALTDTQAVPMPEGFYAEENMRLTVVPNRNAMMLSVAWAVGISEKVDFVSFGAHAGDHFIYEDCRQDFVDKLSAAFSSGTHGDLPVKIIAPFILLDKTGILKLGFDLKVPYEKTWTCYKGEEKACGVCGSCQERLEAFHLNGIEDPLQYETRKLIAKGQYPIPEGRGLPLGKFR
jgi:7-cyano-7-deazaguanine synthase